METIAGSSSELPVRLDVVIGGDRASRKLITDNEDNELPSSAQVVMSNDDLLIEILLLLPVISLHLFKSVSKRWLSLIIDPNFTLRRSQIRNLDPPSGLFLRPCSSVGYDFVPLHTRIPAKRSPFTSSFGSDACNVEILQSCNGLLLCGIKPDKFYVYNPAINLFKMLSHSISPVGLLRMAFDPTKSSHYKVMHARVVQDSIQLETYSSETGNWNVCGDRFPGRSFMNFLDGIYCKDAIHWLDTLNGPLHFKLDVEHPVLTSIQTPGTLTGPLHNGRKLFESRGCLLLLYTEYTHSRQLNIYEMSNWCSGWSVKYIVNLDDITMLFPNTWRMPVRWLCSSVCCIILGEREEDSFLVMQLYGKVVQYKIVLKTLRKLYDLDSIHSPASFQFIASFAGV